VDKYQYTILEHRMSFSWTCPFCNLTQIVTDGQMVTDVSDLSITRQAEGILCLKSKAIGCSNNSCRRTAVHITLITGHRPEKMRPMVIAPKPGVDPIVSMNIAPLGNAKPQPDYIPEVIVKDYYEACLIRDLSPKASATLTRRCLQGMIRDFAGISKARLVDEIIALREALDDGSVDRSVTPETVEAIDHVRGVGNIGAHMERDIDLIVPVDPGEAQALIDLVEMLFDEWYGAREKRKAKLAHIEAIASNKKVLQSAVKKQISAPENENSAKGLAEILPRIDPEGL
jgi:hypothetical protein